MQGRAALLVQDLVVSQGADNTYAWRYGLRTGETTEYPDLTAGWDVRAQFRARPGSDPWVTFGLAVVDGTGITVDESGRIWMHLHHTETEKPEWNAASRREGVYDVELVRPDGEVVRLVMGRVLVSADVTRDE